MPAAATNARARNFTESPLTRASSEVSLTRDESKASYAIIRHNVRTYHSGGVVSVIKGRDSAQTTVEHFERGQSSEDRQAGWRYFLEKTDLKAGMDPEQATNLRQMNLETRESQALALQDHSPDPTRHN